MFKAICDRCGENCGLHAIFLEIRYISNYAVHNKMLGDPSGLNQAHKQFCVCSACSKTMCLPNLYAKPEQDPWDPKWHSLTKDSVRGRDT